ncbi:MAG: PAS domain-containing sensor histidine kinase, partial [Chloroflexota bacterium]|nr:PAS domain-containing sensor histidine kinase [Chloroflexota bacterium]
MPAPEPARSLRTHLADVNPADAPAGLAEADLMLIIDHLVTGVVVVDDRGRTRRLNHIARRYFGDALARVPTVTDAVIAAGMRDARSGRRLTPDRSPITRALSGEVVSSEEVRLPRGSEWVDLCVSAAPMREPSGRVHGAVCIFAPATEYANAENIARLLEAERRARTQTEDALVVLEQDLAERRRLENALRETQHRLRLLVEANQMGTWTYDVAQDRLRWCADMSALLGRAREPFVGSLADGLALVHPDDRPAILRALREHRGLQRSLKLQTRFVKPDGQVGWALLSGGRRDAQSGPDGQISGIALDITERKQAELARQTLLGTQRLRALGQMASGIAHDLNQFLALISGYSDMARHELTQEQPDIGRVREMVEITSRAALQGGQALKGLLSFARTQELMNHSELVDLAELLRDVARLTAPRWRDATQAEGRPIDLRVRTEEGCTIDGSPSALRQAFTNLIFNAVDAMPHGGTIELSVRRHADRVLVEVADSGAGIPPKLQTRIFDPFFTTKGERGTGLGLPQVVAVVERHGGRIELDSAVGRGTTFRMWLPSVAAPEGAATSSGPDKTGGAAG